MRLGHLHFPVADLHRSMAFYRDALGMRVGFEIEGHMAALDGVSLVLDQAGHDPRITAATVAIEVDNVDPLYAALHARGVTLGDEAGTQSWGVRNFYITDPDGYIIEFLQPAEQSVT